MLLRIPWVSRWAQALALAAVQPVARALSCPSSTKNKPRVVNVKKKRNCANALTTAQGDDANCNTKSATTTTPVTPIAMMMGGR
ncbi:hypothetical protein ACLKA6_009848 [Drosophila palustris]